MRVKKIVDGKYVYFLNENYISWDEVNGWRTADDLPGEWVELADASET